MFDDLLGSFCWPFFGSTCETKNHCQRNLAQGYVWSVLHHHMTGTNHLSAYRASSHEYQNGYSWPWWSWTCGILAQSHWIKCWLEVSWLLLHSVKDWDAEERIQTKKKLIQMILWLSSRMAENCKWHVCCRMSLLHRSIYHTESRAKIPKRGVLLRRLGHTHR